MVATSLSLTPLTPGSSSLASILSPIVPPPALPAMPTSLLLSSRRHSATAAATSASSSRRSGGLTGERLAADSGGAAAGLLSPRPLSIPSGLSPTSFASPFSSSSSSSSLLFVSGSPAPKSRSPHRQPQPLPSPPSPTSSSAPLPAVRGDWAQTGRRAERRGDEEAKEAALASSTTPAAVHRGARLATWQGTAATTALSVDANEAEASNGERDSHTRPPLHSSPSSSSPAAQPQSVRPCCVCSSSWCAGCEEKCALACAASSSPFVATFPSSASSHASITVALSPLSPSPLSASLGLPLGPSSPSKQQRAGGVLAQPHSSQPPRSPSAASPPSPHAKVDSRSNGGDRPPLASLSPPRRSSLPLSLPSSSPSPSSPTAASPSSSSSFHLLQRLRGMGSSAWSRSTVDRFGRSSAAQEPEDPNAWGLDEQALHALTAATQQTDSSSRTATRSASSPPAPSSPLASSVSSPHPLPWNFGYLPTQQRGLRRSSLPPQPAASTYADRVRKAAMHRPDSAQYSDRKDRKGRHKTARRRTAQTSAELDDTVRPWGHWSREGIQDGEEPRHPFPHRSHLFTDCTARRSACTDSSCAKHGRWREEEEGEGSDNDEEEAHEAAASARAREGRGVCGEEKEAVSAGVRVHDNMAVVRLRGAGDAALLAAFSRATPAYAALSKLSKEGTQLQHSDGGGLKGLDDGED